MTSVFQPLGNDIPLALRDLDIVWAFGDGVDLTALPDGRFVAVWDTDSGGGITEDIWMAVIAADGQTSTLPVLVSSPITTPSGASLDQWDPTVVARADGGFMIAWTVEEYNYGYNTGRNVWARQFDANGAPITQPYCAVLELGENDVRTSSWEMDPALGRLDDGRIVMAYRNDGHTDLRIYQPDGMTVITVLNVDQVAGGATAYQLYPEVAGLADGGFVVTWQDGTGLDGSSNSVLARQYDAAGVPLGDAFIVNTDHYSAQDDPRVAALDNGGYVIAWASGYDEATESFLTSTRAQMFDASGFPIGGELRLSESFIRYGGDLNFDVVGLPGGGFAAIYAVNLAGTTTSYDLYLQQFDANAQPVGSEMLVNSSVDGWQHRPRLALSHDGTVLEVSWATSYTSPLFIESRAFHVLELGGSGTENADAVAVGDDGGSVNLLGGDDYALGGLGADRIDGGDGNDTLFGGDGADTLIGGIGDDSIIGGDTSADLRDVVYAGAGNDWIDGGYGNDSLRGDDGNDTIEGGFGADTVVGGAGNDVLTGSAWSDLIFGNDGDDFINGGFGHDRLNGGAGADRFYHLGVAGHGSDWIQDYSAADGDRLVFGNTAATRAQFQINWNTTAGAGDGAVQEAFVVYRPTGQIMWALIDGAAQDHIWLQIGGATYDLIA